MTNYPYVFAIGKLNELFERIKKVGVPDVVNAKYLAQLGYKSNNDKRFVPLLKFLGFINSSGVPQNLWTVYRTNSKTAKRALAQAIKESYSQLFSDFPDANRKDNEALRTYFSANTTVGKYALDSIVRTFKALCVLADFEGVPIKITKKESPEKEKEAIFEEAEIAKKIVVNLNIQLQLPASDDPKIYDKLFEALKKHLFSN